MAVHLTHVSVGFTEKEREAINLHGLMVSAEFPLQIGDVLQDYPACGCRSVIMRAVSVDEFTAHQWLIGLTNMPAAESTWFFYELVSD